MKVRLSWYNGSSVWVIQLSEASALLSMLLPPISSCCVTTSVSRPDALQPRERDRVPCRAELPLHLEPPRWAAEHRIPGDGAIGLERISFESTKLRHANRAALDLYTGIHIHHGDFAGCDDRAILPPLRRKQTILYANTFAMTVYYILADNHSRPHLRPQIPHPHLHPFTIDARLLLDAQNSRLAGAQSRRIVQIA